MTSPPFMGGSSVEPLTIISPLPDIIRPMSNCIARAEREVLLATNYWQSSNASTMHSRSFLDVLEIEEKRPLSRSCMIGGTQNKLVILYRQQVRTHANHSIGFIQPPTSCGRGIYRQGQCYPNLLSLDVRFSSKIEHPTSIAERDTPYRYASCELP